MRRFCLLTSLSASLLAFALAGSAEASPRLVVKTGRFEAPGKSLGPTATQPVLDLAARRLLTREIASSGSVELGSARHTSLRSGTRVVKLPQRHKGLPVAYRGASVAFGPDGSARLLAAHLEESLPDDVTPSVTRAEASATAAQRIGLPVDDTRTTLALWPVAGEARLVWAAVAEVPAGFPHRPVAVIDAQSGDVVLIYDAIVALNQAQVFPSNPVKSPDLIEVTLPVGEGEATLKNERVEALNCIDLKSVKKVTYQGITADVHVCDLLPTATPDQNGDFPIPVADDDDPEDEFAEVSLFYHVNRAYDLFRSWAPGFTVQNGPLRVVSNLRVPQGFSTLDFAKLKDPELPLEPFRNAFYSPSDPLFSSVFGISGGALWFGQGVAADYSYDGDVVYHELVHAVAAATINFPFTPLVDDYGVVYAPGAMNEGLADYFSSALTGDGDVGEYVTKDIDPSKTAMRSLTAPDTCSTHVAGEVHQDATLFSGALWDVRTQLDASDQALLDEAVFNAMNVAPTGAINYDELASLIVGEAEELAGKEVADALTAAFTARGVLPKCTRVVAAESGETLDGPLEGIWVAPGRQSVGAKTPSGWTPGVAQFHLALPEGSSELKVEARVIPLFFSGVGTPFKPTFVVRFSDEPITFTKGPLAPNEDALTLDGELDGEFYSLTVDVPEGAGHAHVMIASLSDFDGAFTEVTLTASGHAGSGAGGGDSTGVGVGGGAPTVDAGPTGDDGCSCAVPGSPSHTPLALPLAALAALGLGLTARRHSRRDD